MVVTLEVVLLIVLVPEVVVWEVNVTEVVDDVVVSECRRFTS